VLLPADALLGEEDKGFYYLMNELPQERLMIAVEGQSRAERAFEDTVTWCSERTAFGSPLNDKQVVRHKLAEMKTSLAVGRAFIDSCLVLHNEGKLDAYTASMAKLSATDLAWKVGGYFRSYGSYDYIFPARCRDDLSLFHSLAGMTIACSCHGFWFL
jgi:long-chain-acyl-CoA dehydrogenase